jgi:hypothetical protein
MNKKNNPMWENMFKSETSVRRLKHYIRKTKSSGVKTAARLRIKEIKGK